MKRYFYILFLPALLLIAGCHKEKEEDKLPKQHYRRTVVVYMAMQNSLGAYGHHRIDSMEIVNGMEYIPENDRMLLFIDDASKPRIYELSQKLAHTDEKTGLPYGPKLLKKWREDRNSASAEMLKEVLRYARENYDSDEYGLVMGSHATGWLPKGNVSEGASAKRGPRRTFGVDVGPEGSMRDDEGVGGSKADEIELGDLVTAIKDSGIHPEYILFDACLMQGVEVDYSMRDVTDYIIASPISISSEGAYYTDLMNKGLFTADPIDVARAYADYYLGQGSIPYKDVYGTVISCVRTSAMEDLAATVQQLLRELVPADDATQRLELLKAHRMNGAFYYHPYSERYYWRPHHYDLVSAFQRLEASAEQMERLYTALDRVVVYKAATSSFWVGPSYITFKYMPTNENEWCGISMFVPQQTYTSNASICVFGDLNERYKATDWFKRVY